MDHYKHYSTLPIIQAALDQLEEELPHNLFYHSAKHTKEVLREALLLGTTDQLSERELELLSIAAAYHDIGFIHQRNDNESISANLAQEAMQSQGGYNESEIKLVTDMIRDTQLVETALGIEQIASHPLSRYLLDADLGNLGREDFFEKAELLRQELGLDRSLFFVEARKLLLSHSWLTPAGKKLREGKQKENLEQLDKNLSERKNESTEEGMSLSRLLFLARLPLLLNSTLDPSRIVQTALEHLKKVLSAEAATVFILESDNRQLKFWALTGDESARLHNQRIPADRGIVGWVIKHQKPIRSDEPKKDPRFFHAVDKEGDFETINLVCAPLTVRGVKKLGAIQALNRRGPQPFNDHDLTFLEQFANQLSLAIENALLFEEGEQMRKKLEQLDRRKGEMITVLSHEIRTPLNVIQGASDLLISDDFGDADIRKKMAETLQRGVARLMNLSSQLQGIAKIQTGKVEINPSTVAIGSLYRALSERFENAALDRKLSLTFSHTSEQENVVADEGLLFIVLSNLIANAIRFTNDGGSIKVVTSTEQDKMRFSITDTGIGIPKEELSLIFEKFYEVGDAMEHSSGDFAFRSGGLGLGLSTVRAILAAHHTHIEVTSSLGEGSTFSFSLPTEY